MATGQTEECPGPRREKKREPRGEEAGFDGKKDIRDKGKGGAESGEEMHLQGGSEPQVSLINKELCP
jgi:hypothetical protein